MTLLSLDKLRVDDPSGQVLCAGWTVAAGDTSLALIGDFAPLCRMLSGRAQLASGAALILGQPARTAVQAGSVGLLTSDVVLPRGWTVSVYLQEGGHLLGLSSRSAKELAVATLQRLSLPHLGSRRFETLTLVETRLALLAQALLSDPATLLLQEPFAGLDAASQNDFDARLRHAVQGKHLILTAAGVPQTGGERAALQRADSAVLLQGGALHSGPPSKLLNRASGIAVTVARNGAAFAARLGEAGIVVRPDSPQLSDTGTSMLFAEGGEADLAERLVRAALSADAPVLELLPSGRGGAES